MNLYICGPMTGLPDLNKPAFDEAADALRQAGYTVLNPADAEHMAGDRKEMLALALSWIALAAQGLATLDDWGRSTGATVEVALAVAIGVRIRPLREWLDPDVAAGYLSPAAPSAG